MTVFFSFSSGFNEQDATQHVEGQGWAGFVQKPYVLDEFLQVLPHATSSGLQAPFSLLDIPV